MRLFLAIKPELKNPDLFQELTEELKEIHNIRQVKTENMHITLKFLGEVNQQDLENIVDNLIILKNFKKFKTSITGIGAFPSSSKAKIIWLGVGQGFSEITEIQQKVEKSLMQHLPVENKKFHPHYTLARMRKTIKSKELEKIFKKYGGKTFFEYTVSEIFLIQSDLTPDGPIYSILKKFPLTP